jgi:F0F1-type ATP synthase beta subunit
MAKDASRGDTARNVGTVRSVRSSVVEMRFPERLPEINAMIRAGEGEIPVETITHVDPQTVRGIALTSTEGLAEGAAAVDTGRPLEVPVGDGLLGLLPSRLGYQPTLGTELAQLEERICNTDSGAITSVQAVYVPADDFTDPAAVHTFGHLSASIVLSRKRASEGLYPAIDPLQSGSKMLVPHVVGERHYRIGQEIRRILAEYEDLKDIIAMLGMEELSRDDRRTVQRARRLERFLTQPFFVTEAFTGTEGRRVKLEEALDGCERILGDEFLNYSEQDLYMIGSLDEAVR